MLLKYLYFKTFREAVPRAASSLCFVITALVNQCCRSLLRYTFRNVCIEEKDLELLDGTTKVVLNAAGSKGDVSDDLKGFLNLVAGTVTCEEGTFADRVQKQVRIARQNSKWRRAYMNWKMDLLVQRNRGRDEGAILEQIDIISKKVKKGLGFRKLQTQWKKKKRRSVLSGKP